MKIKRKDPNIKRLARYRKRYQWHKKFALFPVRIDEDTVVWLEFYEKIRTERYGYWYWEKRMCP